MARSISIAGSIVDHTRNITYPAPGVNSFSIGDAVLVMEVPTAVGEGSESLDADMTGGNGPGTLLAINLSTTAAETITIGTTTAQRPILLKASGDGQNWALLHLTSGATALFHAAASGTPRLWFALFESD